MHQNVASQLKTWISMFSSNTNFTVAEIKIICFVLNTFIFLLLD